MPDNVYRIDTDEISGYQVRFERNKKHISRFFNDKFYTDSKRAAEIWRDLKKNELPPVMKNGDRLKKEEIRSRAWESHSRTGVRGIGYTTAELGDGSISVSVAGYWDDGDRWNCTKRSVREHGLEIALLEICERVALETISYRQRAKRPEKAAELFEAALPVFESILEELAPELLQTEDEPSAV